MVYVGSGDMVPVTATASDPDNDTPWNYTWFPPMVDALMEVDYKFKLALRRHATIGAYTVTLNVDDSRGGTATCSAEIRVEARPNHPPANYMQCESFLGFRRRTLPHRV